MSVYISCDQLFKFSLPLAVWSSLCDIWDGSDLVDHSHLCGESFGGLSHCHGQAPLSEQDQDDEDCHWAVDVCNCYFIASSFWLEQLCL